MPVVPRFSRLALGCFVALGVTGVYLAWRQAGELAALPATEFGRLLLIKSAIVLVIIGLASFSRRAVRAGGDVARRLRADRAGRGGARRRRARRDRGAGQRRAGAGQLRPADRRHRAGRATAGASQVHVEPAKQGQNVADIYLVQPDGRLFIPPEIEARLRDGDDLGRCRSS